MRRKKFLYAVILIVVFSTISVWKTYATSASMPNGTVVIGTKAFALSYANDPKNLNEITLAIIAGGEVYVKGYDGIWVNNTTFKIIDPSLIPGVTYKSPTGVLSTYLIGDKLDDELRVDSIK